MICLEAVVEIPLSELNEAVWLQRAAVAEVEPKLSNFPFILHTVNVALKTSTGTFSIGTIDFKTTLKLALFPRQKIFPFGAPLSVIGRMQCSAKDCFRGSFLLAVTLQHSDLSTSELTAAFTTPENTISKLINVWRAPQERKPWLENPQDPDRYDFPGTRTKNELVKHRKQEIQPKAYNFVFHFVRPLHNFLQFHFNLSNEDEIQVMLMPPHRHGKKKRSRNDSGDHKPSRHAYFASNSEKLTQEEINKAISGWNLMNVFSISRLIVVNTGQPGRHSEQKLLEHLLTIRDEYDFTSEKAIVVGERLPCVTCRCFAIQFESIAELLPSHGHFYLSTIGPTLQNFKSEAFERLLVPAEAYKNLQKRVCSH